MRPPQLRALEVYRYLRIVNNTSHIFDLYRDLYPRQSKLLPALGLDSQATKDFVLDKGIDAFRDRICTADDFVQSMNLDSLREALTLASASYILALAMGAGKTTPCALLATLPRHGLRDWSSIHRLHGCDATWLTALFLRI